MKNGQKINRHRGFTLVELIVVLVILAVLSAVAVPTFLGYIDDSKEKECQANMKALVAYLDEARVTDPDAKMEDVLAAHREDVKCPSGGTYEMGEGTGIATVSSLGEGVVFHCSEHGVSKTFGSAGKAVTAKAGENTQTDPNPKKEVPKECIVT